MPETARPRLSVVIVTYNSRADIDRCLESLDRALSGIGHEIVVVDNASSDGTADAIRNRWSHVDVIDAHANVGFAKANNIGIRHTTGELVLLLNPDTSVREGAIQTLVEALTGGGNVGAAGPRLVDANGRAELSFGRMISPLAELRQKILVKGHDRHIPLISHLVERAVRRAHDVDWVSGACLLVRRADAEAAGLLDERYFMYIEDVDFCAELRARGKRIAFVPQAEVVHSRGRSASSAPGPTKAAYRRSQLAFYRKHRPGWMPWLRTYLALRGQLPDP